jgi:hypothetical protein
MRIKEQMLSLECVLTDDEKLACSKLQNEAINQKSQAENELKSFSAQKKAEIAGADAIIALYYQKLSTGKEYRPIKCKVNYDFEKKIREWVRLDTGEICKQDIIPEEDIQEEIELQAKEQEKANEKAEKKNVKK